MELLDPGANGKVAPSLATTKGLVDAALQPASVTSDTQSLLESTVPHHKSSTDINTDSISTTDHKDIKPVFSVQVSSQGRSWVLKRSFADFVFLDRQCHTCVFDRRFSHLPELDGREDKENVPENGENKVGKKPIIITITRFPNCKGQELGV